MSLFRLLAGPMAVLALALAPACKKSAEEKEIKDLQVKAAELDKLNQQSGEAGMSQAAKLKEAGAGDVRLNAETMQLTPEQKQVLEERIKAEKNSSYKELLQEVIDKDKEIKELNDKITKLRSILPRPDVAKANDSHYGLAIKFLKKKGVNEAQARKLVGRVLIMDKLAPGFEVYHFYSNGVYGTWVSQGKARVSPSELQAEEKAKIEGERDTAVANNDALKEEVADLMAQKKKITEDIENLRGEKEKMLKDMEALAATNESQKAKLNSLHYLVGNRKKLEKDGIIVVPTFAKDRAGANWSDSAFNKSMDLRNADTITIAAADYGLKQIAKVSVVPGSLIKDEHYTVTLSADKATATIKLLKKDRFKNEKVVFAVID